VAIEREALLRYLASARAKSLGKLRVA